MQADVAIVGGGPAGLAAAHAILRARPHTKLAILERSDLRPRGATFGLLPNGVRALEAINPDLKPVLARQHLGSARTRRFAPSGELVDDSQENSFVMAVSEHGEVIELPWHVFQRELAGQLPEGVLHTRHQFLRYTETQDGVMAEFATPDGTMEVSAQLLLGCDGGQSLVRERLLGDGPPKHLGLAIWRAVCAQPADWLPGWAMWGVPGKSVITRTLRDGKMAWQAFAPWPEARLGEIGGGRKAYIVDEEVAQERMQQGSVAGAGRERLERASATFEDYPLVVRDLIASTDPTAVTEHGQFCREAEDCQVYAKGRVGLTGDAAHMATPFLGQGVNQAIEDALELGRAIGEHGPTPVALEAYQAVRVPAASEVQAASVELCKAFARGDMSQTERDVNIGRGFVKRAFEPLVESAAAVAAAV